MSDFESALEKIKNLERIIEKQNILIDALVEQNRSLKAKEKNSEDVAMYISSIALEKSEVKQNTYHEQCQKQSYTIPGIDSGFQNAMPESITKKINTADVQAINCEIDERRDERKDFYDKCVPERQNDHILVAEAADQILMFLEKKHEKSMPFKPNFSFKEFVTYCTHMNYDIKAEFSKIKVGCGVRSYLCTNEKAFVYYVTENINDMSLDEAFCTLLILSRVIDRTVKIAVMYNLLQSLDNQYLLLHLAFSVLNGEVLGSSAVEITLRKILCFQLAIDSDVFRDSRIKEALRHISVSLSLSPEKEDLAKHVINIVENMDFRAHTMGAENIDEIVSIQMVCMFFDWEWSFDFLIRKYLFQKTGCRDMKSVYLMGTVASMGLALVGRHDSVAIVFDELRRYMHQNDVDIGAICYYFVKRLDPKAAYKWIRTNRRYIEERAVINIKSLLEDPVVF